MMGQYYLPVIPASNRPIKKQSLSTLIKNLKVSKVAKCNFSFPLAISQGTNMLYGATPFSEAILFFNQNAYAFKISSQAVI